MRVSLGTWISLVVIATLNFQCQDSRPERTVLPFTVHAGELHFSSNQHGVEEHLGIKFNPDSTLSYTYIVSRSRCEQRYAGQAHLSSESDSGYFYLSSDSVSIQSFIISFDSTKANLSFQRKERGDCLGAEYPLMRVLN